MINPHIRLDWLVSFLAVVDHGGFGAAAEATHRSQPRVSAHVASLERAVGVMVLDRSKRPAELTEAGQTLAAHARAILHRVEAAETDMANWRGGSRGVVHLGAHPSASAAFVPRVIMELAEAAPDINVSLLERSTLELDEAMRVGEVDLYLRPLSPPPEDPRVTSRALWREDLVVVIPDGHPLTTSDAPLNVRDVLDHPLISIGTLDSPVPPSFETYELFRAAGHELEPVQATNLPQTLVSMVRSGLGLGVTNRLAVQESAANGVHLRTLSGGHHRVVGVCWNRDIVLSPAAMTLLQQLVETPVPPGTTAAR